MLDLSSEKRYNWKVKNIFLKLRKYLIASIILAVFAINIFFGVPRLATYSSVDEPYWTYDRTPDFWKAVAHQKWKSTDINDKPGITVAEISGLGLFSGVRPLEYKSFRQEPKTPEVAAEMIKINFALRLPIYLACLAFLLIFFFFIKKLFNETIAVLSLIFIGLSPIILGISLIINPDSLLWGFLPLSIISYLVYQKENRKKYLIFSGVLLGLSLLTKYVANILYVYLFGLIFLGYIYSWKSENNFSAYIKKGLRDYGILVLISLLTFFVFYPKCWVEPKTLLKGTILSAAFKSTWPLFAGFIGLLLADLFLLKSRVFSAVIGFLGRHRHYFKSALGALFLSGIIFVLFNTYSGMPIFDFEAEMASPKGENVLTFAHLAKIISSDLYALVFGLTPVVLFFFIFSVLKNTFQKGALSKESAVVSYFLIFILIYYVASTVNHVTATIRYQIVTFPLAAIIAAIGAYQFLQIPGIKKYAKDYLAYLVFIVISCVSLFLAAPHFFNYASSLLPDNYVLNLKDMGDGSYEAAQFLNRLPDAQNLIIWSDKGAVCETFLGQCKVSFNKNDTQDIDFDYFVVSAGRKSRSLKLELAADFTPEIDFKKLYMSGFSEADYEINFGGNANNFVRVVRKDKVLE